MTTRHSKLIVSASGMKGVGVLLLFLIYFFIHAYNYSVSYVIFLYFIFSAVHFSIYIYLIKWYLALFWQLIA